MTGRSTAMQPTDDEHQRFARYLQELADAGSQDEVDLVARVLRDPDTVMAQSAMVRHLDRRAAQLPADASFRLDRGHGHRDRGVGVPRSPPARMDGVEVDRRQ
ncbi:hypothetical protein [Nonomuraea cavernae]|uniref:Uncharacterized protein n=1 Tax=Nonomuraea cavernae TaxID=2045107 RepID=A0A917Z0M4_9ACTN|nr:hypothetical protein [Nonomuraea cavernae]MCA2187772.1 hypothetical protein [Nonomuraea cavernae]GGO71810.1 hypothetical protein GCM10012289_38360 [Nonomuraea cavernae]